MLIASSFLNKLHQFVDESSQVMIKGSCTHEQESEDAKIESKILSKLSFKSNKYFSII